MKEDVFSQRGRLPGVIFRETKTKRCKNARGRGRERWEKRREKKHNEERKAEGKKGEYGPPPYLVSLSKEFVRSRSVISFQVARAKEIGRECGSERKEDVTTTGVWRRACALRGWKS